MHGIIILASLQTLFFFMLVFLIGFLPIPFVGSVIFLLISILIGIPLGMAIFGALIVLILNIISFILYTLTK